MAQWNWPQLNDPVEILRVNDFSLCFGSTPTWEHRLRMSRQVGQEIEGYDGYVYRLNVTWEYMLHGQWNWKDDLPVNWGQPYDRHETGILVQCGWQNIYYRLKVQKERRYEGSYFWQPYDDPEYTWETMIGPDNTIHPGSLKEITMCPGQPVNIENSQAATGNLGTLQYRFEVCYTGGKCDTENWHQSHATSFETPAIATNTTNTGVYNFTPQYGETIKWVRRIVYNDEGCNLYNPEMPGTGDKRYKEELVTYATAHALENSHLSPGSIGLTRGGAIINICLGVFEPHQQGSITIQTPAVCPGTSGNKITGTAQTGGNAANSSYRWQKSTD